jgi:hypothetical protein
MNTLLRHFDTTLIIGLLVAFFLILICYKWLAIYFVGKWRAYKRGYSITSSNLFFMHSEKCFDERFFDGLKLFKEKGYTAPIYDICVSYKVEGFSFEEMVETMDYITEHKMDISLRQVLMVQRQKLGKTLPLVQKCAQSFPINFRVNYPDAQLTLKATANFVFPNVAYCNDDVVSVTKRMEAYVKAFVPENTKNKDIVVTYWNRYFSTATLLEQFSVALQDVETDWQLK